MSFLCRSSKLTRNTSYLFKYYKNIVVGHTHDNIRRFTSSAKKSRSFVKLGLVGVTLGGVIGTGYSIHQLNQPKTHILNEEVAIPLIENPPEIPPSKKIRIPGDQSGLKLTLYQYQTCPFCCKVRAFLDYYGISYDVIEVDPVLRQSIKWSPYKKVPILLVNVGENKYQPLNDSSMIISALSSVLRDSKRDIEEITGYYPFISFQDEDGSIKKDIMNKYFLMLGENADRLKSLDDINEERKWRKWADQVLVHVLSPNVYRTREEALQAFGWFSEVAEWDKHFPVWEKYLMVYVGAYAMWLVGKRLKKRHHLKDDVRQSLYDECNYWVKEVNKKGTPFMGGKEPNLADLSVYGILSSIEGCDAFQDLLKKSNIKTWYYNMKEAVTKHQGCEFA
ncbi:prostaglandin E synthase 2 [Agrilus planipennis]|uniref:Prostaglandin E synthase 2 n=1 Tax=Agrilus planipennis TaxID=224129 RepID=A0A1W4W787_AGRPL|nr:prostaglandin E synthase 2 [Agrilus planipennis]